MSATRLPEQKFPYRLGRRVTGQDRSARRRPFLSCELLEPRLLLSHGPTDHVHARLSIFLEGQPVTIPANIGLSATGHSNPHTHDGDPLGTLHMGEGGPAGLSNQIRLVTLDDFFDVWRERGGFPGDNPNSVFDKDHLLNKTADASHVIHMFVNGQHNSEFERYTPHDSDEIVIRYDALPSPPTGLALLAASDSGSLNNDRITNLTNLQIQVSGVTSGATVEVRSGGATLGQATAAGTTVIVTANAGSLAEGQRSFTAVQTVSGLSSLASAALTVTLDRTAPQFSLTPRAALAGQSWNQDITSADEAAAGFGYTLAAASAGVTLLAPSTGVLAWTPTASQIGQHTLTVRATDAAGNVREQTARVFVVEAAFPWRNPVDALDVDGDGTIVPLDALLMINRLNSPASWILQMPSSAEAPPPFYDPTKDNNCTPQDVLWVLNFLNGQTAEGEAEASLNVPVTAMSASPTMVNPERILGSGVASGSPTAADVVHLPKAGQVSLTLPAANTSSPQISVRRASTASPVSAIGVDEWESLLDALARNGTPCR